MNRFDNPTKRRAGSGSEGVADLVDGDPHRVYTEVYARRLITLDNFS